MNHKDERRLSIPADVQSDDGAIELISVWHSRGKVKIMTRSGTRLDQSPAIWGEILAGLAANIALCTRDETGVDSSVTLATMKRAVNRAWPKQ